MSAGDGHGSGLITCPSQRCGAANPPDAQFCRVCGATLEKETVPIDLAPPPGRPGFGPAFWVLNSVEMFERLAYFGVRVVVPIYIMQKDEPGGLHLSAADKGNIYAWWFIFQSVLPMFTGGFADRYGFKRTMAFSIVMNMIGYILMAFMRDYWSFFAAVMVLATGTAFFKPSIQGSLAQNLTRLNSSLGWGIFYWVVNIGGLIGPFVSALIFPAIADQRGYFHWKLLFLASAGFTACNLLLLLAFKDVPSGADKRRGPLEVLWMTLENIWPYWMRGGVFEPARGIPGLVLFSAGVFLSLYWPPFMPQLLRTGLPPALVAVGLILVAWLRGGEFRWQLRLPAWLVIMAGFWLMMYQLWDLHPTFIVDWVDSSAMAASIAWLPDGAYNTLVDQTDRGAQVKQQMLLNINAAFIVLFIVLVSWLVSRMRTLSAMLIGMSIATVGILVAGLTANGWVLALGIVFFSIGEMLTGPKKNEYLGLIAPPGKKGLYLGYVNIPVGIGGYVGSKMHGYLYGHFGEKAVLAQKYIAQHMPDAAAQPWDGRLSSLSTAAGVEPTQAFARLQALTGLDAPAATRLLWETYDPQYAVWIPFAVIGVLSAISLAIFGQMAKRWKDMNA